MAAPAPIMSGVPKSTVAWLLEPQNPPVAVLTKRTLLGEADSPETTALWDSRDSYAPVAAILEAIREDGSWATPAQDYQKYRGSLWQIHFLGELHASGESDRARRGTAYAFSRQLPDGSWSATNMRPDGSLACLTANVGRALARLGFERDERVVQALRYCVETHHTVGAIDCRQGRLYQLNGYCHMLTPKLLLFLAEVPAALWPEGAAELRDACVTALRDKQVFHCLPAEAREFNDALWTMPQSERRGFRERFLAEHPDLHYGAKPGWLRFGFPLSYNSDILEALAALAGVGETRRPEYEPALEAVAAAADASMGWTMRNSLNGKMIADVESKGAPSKWLTLRALQVLDHFGWEVGTR